MLKQLLVMTLMALFALPAFSQVTDIGRSSDGERPLTTADFGTSNGAGTYLIGKAYRNATLNLDHNGGLAGNLYACDVPDYVAASCSTSLSTLDADVIDASISTGRRFYVAVVTSAATATAYLTLKGSYDAAGGGGGGVPGVTGTTGNDETFNHMIGLRRFASLSNQLVAEEWVDPFWGSDTTGDGSYENPYFSLAKHKRECWSRVGNRCRVKGKNPAFGHTLLTVTYSAADGHFMPGEVVDIASPTGTAEVIRVERNKVLLDWVSGDDPTTASTLTGQDSGVAATIDAIQDSLNGLPNVVFINTAIDTTGDTITVTGHPYNDLDGPFRFYNQTTMPSFTGASIDRATEDVWVCNPTANTFQLGVDSACVAVYDFSSQGAGDNQLLAGLLPTPGLMGTVDLQDCADPDRLCVTFEPENDTDTIVVAGARKNLGGQMAHVAYDWWSGLTPARVGGGDTCSGGPTAGPCYNPATGGLFNASSTVQDPTQTGWFGVRNVKVLNIAADCIAAGNGGKVLALNVTCEGIRNGAGDRSQESVAFAYEQAHNSVATSGGTNTDPLLVGGVVYVIGGDGAISEWGSNEGSGGMFNPNNQGVVSVLSRGTFSQDKIPGDNCDSVGNNPCSSPQVVMPGGETVFVGATMEFGGNETLARWMNWGGDIARVQIAKSVLRPLGVWGGDTVQAPSVVTIVPGGLNGKTREFYAWNVTLNPTGDQFIVKFCPIGHNNGTSIEYGSGTTARMKMEWKNVIFDDWIPAAPYRISATDCAAAGAIDADAVARADVKFEGIWDVDENTACGGGTGPCFVYDITSRGIGACGVANRFLDDVCNAVDQSGAQAVDGQWTWFSNNSADSGGLGVDGLQWDADDNLFRCAGSAKECFRDATINTEPFTVSLRSVYGGADTSCIPEDLLGVKLCALRMEPVNIGAR